ncbi:MAG: hypothetical protein U9Q15_05650 [Patescibacteria group bacterium]|nr:hypothetical protein [Patescibacteria group bacterium]
MLTGSVSIGKEYCPIQDEFIYTENGGWIMKCNVQQEVVSMTGSQAALRGFMYSDIYGWIALSQADLIEAYGDMYGPFPEFEVTMTHTGGTVSDPNPTKILLGGYAFSDATGFINLAGTGSSPGVFIDLSESSQNEMKGFAWSENIGYVSFSGDNHTTGYTEYGFQHMYGDVVGSNSKVDGYDIAEYVYKMSQSGTDIISDQNWDLIIDKYKESNNYTNN